MMDESIVRQRAEDILIRGGSIRLASTVCSLSRQQVEDLKKELTQTCRVRPSAVERPHRIPVAETEQERQRNAADVLRLIFTGLRGVRDPMSSFTLARYLAVPGVTPEDLEELLPILESLKWAVKTTHHWSGVCGHIWIGPDLLTMRDEDIPEDLLDFLREKIAIGEQARAATRGGSSSKDVVVTREEAFLHDEVSRKPLAVAICTLLQITSAPMLVGALAQRLHLLSAPPGAFLEAMNLLCACGAIKKFGEQAGRPIYFWALGEKNPDQEVPQDVICKIQQLLEPHHQPPHRTIPTFSGRALNYSDIAAMEDIPRPGARIKRFKPSQLG